MPHLRPTKPADRQDLEPSFFGIRKINSARKWIAAELYSREPTRLFGADFGAAGALVNQNSTASATAVTACVNRYQFS